LDGNKPESGNFTSNPIVVPVSYHYSGKSKASAHKPYCENVKCQGRGINLAKPAGRNVCTQFEAFQEEASQLGFVRDLVRV
jgi:hypothetical protein